MLSTHAQKQFLDWLTNYSIEMIEELQKLPYKLICIKLFFGYERKDLQEYVNAKRKIIGIFRMFTKHNACVFEKSKSFIEEKLVVIKQEYLEKINRVNERTQIENAITVITNKIEAINQIAHDETPEFNSKATTVFFRKIFTENRVEVYIPAEKIQAYIDFEIYQQFLQSNRLGESAILMLHNAHLELLLKVLQENPIIFIQEMEDDKSSITIQNRRG